MITRTLVVTITLILVLTPQAVLADESHTKTLSPYFQVTSAASEGVELLPLESTSAEVDISGVIADVRVTQVYQNSGNVPLEAKYVFPASTRAAVYAMQMTIGERVRIAKIKERQAAKATYAKAKSEGKSASLLEQNRPNVFQMSVANIMPGDRIKVELAYTELLVPTDGVYEFVYPTVVGPRYSDTPIAEAKETDRWVSNPYLSEGEEAPYKFDLNLRIATGIPIKMLRSDTHLIETNWKEESEAEVGLHSREHSGGNRDFVLHYRLQGDAIESGILLHEGEAENFFLLMMQPPKRVQLESIPPREYIFVVDVSGSMHGFPLETSKRLLTDLVSHLRPTDTFNILLFSGGSELFEDRSVSATQENVKRAIRFLDRQRGGGSTQLLPALRRALALPQGENVSRSFVIATDGYVIVEPETFDLIRNHLDTANVFAFGIGSSVNRFLIEGMARAGKGEAFIVDRPREAQRIATQFRKYIETPVLTNIEFEFSGFKAYDLDPPAAPDLFAERPIIVAGKWQDQPHGTIKVRGQIGEVSFYKELEVTEQKLDLPTEGLRYLWARSRIATLGDYQQVAAHSHYRDEIIELGLKYNLLTKFTSFVAVDDIVRNTTGSLESVKQPLPLPKGVSNLAVGGSVASVPEPETYALLLVLGMLLLWQAHRIGALRLPLGGN